MMWPSAAKGVDFCPEDAKSPSPTSGLQSLQLLEERALVSEGELRSWGSQRRLGIPAGFARGVQRAPLLGARPFPRTPGSPDE